MDRHPRTLRGRGIVRGEARGPAIVSNSPISFLGDVDIRTGMVIGKMNDLNGRKISGSVLVVPATGGSAGAWRFLYQLKQHNTHPAAIIVDDLPDPSVVQGAILSGIPIVSNIEAALRKCVRDGDTLSVNGTDGEVTMFPTSA